jgi:hypothetical protein
MKSRIISAALLFCLFSIGCKKNVDLKPTDSITEDIAYNSVAALQKGLNTAYATYSVARVDRSLVAAITSDEVKFGPNNGGTGQFGYRLQYNADATSGGDVVAGWAAYYAVIDRVNRVLGRMAEIPANGTAEVAQKNAIQGQLLALRGMAHFELLEAYSKKYDAADPLGVIVMTQSCLTCFPARSTVAEVISRVEQDLADAKALMPAVTAAGYNDLALNPVSVTAIQARVALHKGEWQKAADLATSVITSGVKTLATGSSFTGIWTDANTNEILFRSRFETSATLGSQWTNASSIIFSPSDKLTASYSASDIRLNTYIGTTGGSRFVKKFSTSSRGGNVVDLKVVRVSEMYLIRAEARAELNDLAGAASDINTLRAARIAGYTPITYADKASAIDDILLERFRELAFEGFRFFDLKRRGLSLQRNASDVDSPLWQTLAASDKRFVYPIPADEILANPNVIQNPGY